MQEDCFVPITSKIKTKFPLVELISNEGLTDQAFHGEIMVVGDSLSRQNLRGSGRKKVRTYLGVIDAPPDLAEKSQW